MANHRGIADWFSLTFEHSADVFCAHCGTETESPISKLTLNEAVATHPLNDKAVRPGND